METAPMDTQAKSPSMELHPLQHLAHRPASAPLLADTAPATTGSPICSFISEWHNHAIKKKKAVSIDSISNTPFFHTLKIPGYMRHAFLSFDTCFFATASYPTLVACAFIDFYAHFPIHFEKTSQGPAILLRSAVHSALS